MQAGDERHHEVQFISTRETPPLKKRRSFEIRQICYVGNVGINYYLGTTTR